MSLQQMILLYCFRNLRWWGLDLIYQWNTLKISLSLRNLQTSRTGVKITLEFLGSS